MFLLRCGDCGSLNPPDLGTLRVTETVRCKYCGKARRVRTDWRELGDSVAEHEERARAFAADAQVDLPAAYAVLLGLMRLPAPEQRRAGAAPITRPAPPEVDLTSVALGPEPVAVLPGEQSPAPRGRWLRRVGVLLLMFASAWIGGLWQSATTLPEPGRIRPPLERAWSEVVVTRNERERVVSVTAPSAGLVLQAYCEATGGLEPVELASAVPPRHGVRIGLLRDSRNGLELAIEIERRSADLWGTGSAGQPVVPASAPELPPGTATFPIDR